MSGQAPGTLLWTVVVWADRSRASSSPRGRLLRAERCSILPFRRTAVMNQSKLRRILKRIAIELAKAMPSREALEDSGLKGVPASWIALSGPPEELADETWVAHVVSLNRVRNILVRYRHPLEKLQKKVLSADEEWGIAEWRAKPSAYLRLKDGLSEQCADAVLVNDRWLRLMRDPSPFAVHLLLGVGLGSTELPETDALIKLRDLVDGMIGSVDELIAKGELVPKLDIPPARLELAAATLSGNGWSDSSMPAMLRRMLDGPKKASVLLSLSGGSSRGYVYRVLDSMVDLGLLEVLWIDSAQHWRLTLLGHDVLAVWDRQRAKQ